MAKIPFTKLGLKISDEVKVTEFNGQSIEVKQYLSIKDKLDLVSITLQQCGGENFFNPMEMDVYFHINMVLMYTNINFTEKQKEDKLKLYDLLESNGIFNLVISNIPENEYQNLVETIEKCAKSIETYSNSFIGSLATMESNVGDGGDKVKEIIGLVQDDDNLALLKEIITKYRD